MLASSSIYRETNLTPTSFGMFSTQTLAILSISRQFICLTKGVIRSNREIVLSADLLDVLTVSSEFLSLCCIDSSKIVWGVSHSCGPNNHYETLLCPSIWAFANDISTKMPPRYRKSTECFHTPQKKCEKNQKKELTLEQMHFTFYKT